MFFLPTIISSLLFLLLLKQPRKRRFFQSDTDIYFAFLSTFPTLVSPILLFPQSEMYVCVCVCVIYFSDLRLGLVNTRCFRIILKLRSVRLLLQMLHHWSLLLTFWCLSKQGEPCNVPRNPRCVGVESYTTLLSCVHVDIKCVCVCVCLHMSACGQSIQFHNLPWSLNHIRFLTENNKNRKIKSKGTAGNCPQG